MTAAVALANVPGMDLTDQEQETRRERLRAWIASHGGHAKVVEARRLRPSYASYVSQVVHGYSFGPRAARGMERRLGMPERFLDTAQPAERSTPAVQAREKLEVAERFEAQQVRAALEQALAVVLERIELLPPEVRAAVGHNLDGWARASGAEPYHQIVLMLLTGGTAPRPPA